MTEKASSIIDFIAQKSGAEARAALTTAEKVAQREADQAKRRAGARLQAASSALKAQIDAEKALANARSFAEASRLKLQRRQELVEGLLAAALKRLSDAPRDDSYLRVQARLVRQAAEALGGNQTVVVCSAKDRDFLNREGRFGRIAESVRGATGVSLGLAEETAVMSGGVILRTPDGRVSYYNTFDEIAYRRRSELRSLIAKELFG